MKALLVGAGRMGLTHMAQLNLLTDFGIKWTVAEPSFAVRRGLSFFLPNEMLDNVHSNPGEATGVFDIAVICSPTIHHQSGWDMLKSRAGRIFVEKPLKVTNPSESLLCGYVLLHHPLQRRFVDRYAVGAKAFSLSLRANTVLGPNRGWRGHKATGGGVVSEFGSHLLSLLIDLTGPVASLKLDSEKTVFSVDAPDIAMLSGISTSGAPFSLKLDWTDENVRKPTYEVSVEMQDGRTASHDFYEMVDGEDRLSIAALESACGVYLRGIEFTEQARFFLQNESYPHHLGIAVEVDRLLETLK